MGYHLDPQDENAIVLDGIREGIADSPYEGISDMRNVNIVPIPDEGSVNFATAANVDTNGTGTVVSADAGADTITISGTLAGGQAVIFAGGSLPGGVTAGVLYFPTLISAGVFKLYTDYAQTAPNLVNISGTGTGTFATVNMGAPKNFTHLVTQFVDAYFMVDANGRVWSTFLQAMQSTWRYTGNTITGTNGTTHGNGIVSYVPSDSNTTGKGYVFVFRDFQIDYATITSNTTLTWTYGWNPATGTASNNNYLKNASSGTLTNLSHKAMVATDNRVYYCDANYVGRFYQTDPAVGFDPASTVTYTFDNTTVLPFTDSAKCLTQLGTNLLVGGAMNIIYPWDRFSSTNSNPILIAEYNVQEMVTVNTNVYIFAGNRGRIYVTNGTNADFYRKLPDHLSGVVEPYYVWGGAATSKNQLYFSALVTSNTGSALSVMGGLWAIDLDTKAIRLSNQLSYATYAGYATAITPIFSSTAPGTGLYIGWDSGASTYGIDITVSTPYTSSQAYIDWDLLPIGTFLRPKTFKTVEYKLSQPMVSGESVSIYYRLNFNTSYTLIFTSNTAGIFSDNNPVNFENAQWVQLRSVINSTVTTPTFTRLSEIRIK